MDRPSILLFPLLLHHFFTLFRLSCVLFRALVCPDPNRSLDAVTTAQLQQQSGITPTQPNRCVAQIVVHKDHDSQHSCYRADRGRNARPAMVRGTEPGRGVEASPPTPRFAAERLIAEHESRLERLPFGPALLPRARESCRREVAEGCCCEWFRAAVASDRAERDESGG